MLKSRAKCFQGNLKVSTGFTPFHHSYYFLKKQNTEISAQNVSMLIHKSSGQFRAAQVRMSTSFLKFDWPRDALQAHFACKALCLRHE